MALTLNAAETWREQRRQLIEEGPAQVDARLAAGLTTALEVLRESALVERYEGDFGSADRLLGRSELIARQEGYDLELGQALFLRATIAHHRGAFADARDLLRQAAAWRRAHESAA